MLDFEMFDANLNNIINYINLRSDYDKIDNYLYYIIDTNSKLNPSDINTKLDNVRSMYEDIFNVKNVYYYPHNLSIFKGKRNNTILNFFNITIFLFFYINYTVISIFVSIYWNAWFTLTKSFIFSLKYVVFLEYYF